MMVTVRLFAAAREALRQSELQIEMQATATVGELRRALRREYPLLTEILAHSKFAINEDYANDQQQIPAEATVACIPPVSGG